MQNVTILKLRFGIHLEDFTEGEHFRPHGPLFHRWLPNGKYDEIALDVGNSNLALVVWFERFGTADETGWIRFDREKKSIDPGLMTKHAVLDGGPMFGEFTWKNPPADELQAMRDGLHGDPRYESLGKQVIHFLCPCLSKFLWLLRINYGQHWLTELKPFDSTHASLGNYCSLLGLKWSLDDGVSWTPFRPDRATVYLTGSVSGSDTFQDLLSQSDWNELSAVYRAYDQPTTAGHLLCQARHLFDTGEFKYAFLEGVTALEVALSEFIRQRATALENELAKEVFEQLKALKLRHRLCAVATMSKICSADDLKKCVEAILIRNKITHDGKDMPRGKHHTLKALFRVVAALLPGPPCRFPSQNRGNMLRAPEDWETLYKSTIRPGNGESAKVGR